MGKRNFKRDRFRNDFLRNNQIVCYDCKQPEHIMSDSPLNKQAKKDKKKKKAMVATCSESDPSIFDEEYEVEVKANLCLMENDDEVCDDELDDYDTLQNEYECLI